VGIKIKRYVKKPLKLNSVEVALLFFKLYNPPMPVEKFNFIISQDDSQQASTTARGCGGVVLSVVCENIENNSSTSVNGPSGVWGVYVTKSNVDQNNTYCDTSIENALLSTGMFTSSFLPNGMFIIPTYRCFSISNEVCLYVASLLKKEGHFVTII